MGDGSMTSVVCIHKSNAREHRFIDALYNLHHSHHAFTLLF